LLFFFFFYDESELTFDNGIYFIYFFFLSETNLKLRKAPVQTGHLSLKSLSELKGTLQCEVLLLLSSLSPSPLVRAASVGRELWLMAKCDGGSRVGAASRDVLVQGHPAPRLRVAGHPTRQPAAASAELVFA
jgi:hypothetical protein